MTRRMLLLAAAAACSCAFTHLAIADNVRTLLNEGASLTADRAATLETQLEANPPDTVVRTRLLGYYQRQTRIPKARTKAYDRLRSHVLWLIRNEPKSEVLTAPQSRLLLEFNRELAPERFVEGKRAFLAHLEKEPNDLKLLEHAADFVSFRDRELAIELCERARSLDSSNPEWTIRLAFHHYNDYRAPYHGKPDVEAARRALVEFDRGFELVGETRFEGYLPLAAKVAIVAEDIAKAREYAHLMLGDARADSPRYGKNVHYGNITLGKIALAEGDVQGPVSYLLLAGSTPGSSELQVEGPDTELAKELLDRGEQESVLQYFDLCADFWERGQDRLEEWAVLVRAGKIPTFGRR